MLHDQGSCPPVSMFTRRTRFVWLFVFVCMSAKTGVESSRCIVSEPASESESANFNDERKCSVRRSPIEGARPSIRLFDPPPVLSSGNWSSALMRRKSMCMVFDSRRY